MLHNGECIRASFLAPSGHICFTCSWRPRGKRRATLSPSYFLSSPSLKERYALAVCLDYLPSNQLSENWSDRFWGPVLSIPVADGEKRRRLESRQCCAPSHRRPHANRVAFLLKPRLLSLTSFQVCLMMEWICSFYLQQCASFASFLSDFNCCSLLGTLWLCKISHFCIKILCLQQTQQSQQ